MKEHKIKILPNHISNKIAAGEVVQRPLSVVKELLENSIDANAKMIEINLKNSGLDKIEIIDDGIGMNRENLEVCLFRHSTSKIETDEDIFKIATLGFRGEALASISSISKFTLVSSIDGIQAYELTKNGDEEQNIKEVGANKGTKIIVDNLFFNTPARYKHLSSTFYELSLIVQYINKMSLIRPDIKFVLTNNDNELFSSFGDGNVQNVIQRIYNTNIAKNVVAFENKNEHFIVNFWIVKPQITRNKKNHMYISVNNRSIRNLAIEKLIIKGYGHYLHTNQFPIVFLDIKTDYSLIDINIHPTKEQIKISLMDKLEDLIVKSIDENLKKEEYISRPDIEDYKVNINNINKDNYSTLTKEENSILESMLEYNNKEDRKEKFSNKTYSILNEEYSPDKEKKENIINEEEISKSTSYKEENTIKEEDTSKPTSYKEENTIKEEDTSKLTSYKDYFKDMDVEETNINTFKKSCEELNQSSTNENVNINSNKQYRQTLIKHATYVGIFHKTYILFENENGIYFVDQHAAQERIRYEQILNKFIKKEYNFQRSLIPQVFDFTTDEFLLIMDKIKKFKDLGLVFENFGPNTLRLVEADVWYLKGKNQEQNIRSIFSKIIKQPDIEFGDIVDEIAISIACKGAIKANDFITSEDALNLLEQLSKAKEPYTCPHGRPIIVNLEQYQIQKMFKRVN